MKRWMILFAAIATAGFLSGGAQAALVLKGLGEIAGGGGGEYQLIYDTELDITWLDYTHPADTWADQTAWADGLVVTVNGQTYDEWRLPDTLPVNGSTYNYTPYPLPFGYDGSYDLGYNISAPGTTYEGSTGSEMAHLYYYTLQNQGGVDTQGNPQSVGDLKTGIFTNLLGEEEYWSGTDYTLLAGFGWFFDFDDGFQFYDMVSDEKVAIAVLQGNVTVPIPGSVLLLGPGILCLGLLSRRRQRLSCATVPAL